MIKKTDKADLPIKLKGMNEIIDQYELFILDQWGVLHNGVNVFPGTLMVLETLRKKNKQIVILSNSGKPADYATHRMAQIGIDPKLYDFMLTSGEHARISLRQRDEDFFKALGHKYYVFAWNAQEQEVMEGLDYQQVNTVEAADFIVCAGLETTHIKSFDARLEAANQRNLPMICVNSDLVTVTPSGNLVPCPGTLAKRYVDMGGKVRWHGKPDPWLYKTIAQKFGSLDKAIAVGDSLSHDIKGANLAGIDNILVTSGIHEQELPRPPSSESVRQLAQHYQASVTFFMQNFQP